jgi:D-sedoheptulose 7-phosphate isomerase
MSIESAPRSPRVQTTQTTQGTQMTQTTQPAPKLPRTPCDHRHLDELVTALGGFSACVDVADRWGEHLGSVLAGGGRLLAAGNGGSAAQAQHLTAELVGRYRDERRPLSAVALCAETSSLTAIINDYPPTELFARQVEAHGREGDVLVLMSTSGRSPNLLAAARSGHDVGMTVWAFTGPRPNPLAELADETLAVDAPFTATVQELHLVGVHILCASVDRALGIISAPRTQPAGARTA